MKRILVAVPTFETIYPDTFESIYNLDCGGNSVVFKFVRGYDCATARNRIAQMSMDLKANYVFMVDNDVVLPKDALINLLEGECDICLGYYAHRDTDNVYRERTCICRMFQPDGTKYYHYPLESEYTGKEMKEMCANGVHKVQIHGGGMGCALIKVDLFRKLEYPWFDWVNYKDKNHGMLSEDLYLCEQCKNHNIPIFADTRVACGHMLRHVQWPE